MNPGTLFFANQYLHVIFVFAQALTRQLVTKIGAQRQPVKRLEQLKGYHWQFLRAIFVFQHLSVWGIGPNKYPEMNLRCLNATNQRTHTHTTHKHETNGPRHLLVAHLNMPLAQRH